VCFGGGLQIASGADVRVVAPDTRMAVMEMRWGLVPDMGGIALWRGLIRDDVLRELTFTNREFTGMEAQAIGLATYVEENPLDRAIAIARTMADKNTADLLLEESLEQHPLLGSKNQMEAVMAGMQKRKANYEDV
jgi:enoyl-CoA hydratase/carnithine racemase